MPEPHCGQEEELRAAVGRRDQEIQHLLSVLPDSGPNSDVAELEEANIRNQELIAQLKEQLDFAAAQAVNSERVRSLVPPALHADRPPGAYRRALEERGPAVWAARGAAQV